MQPTQAPRLQQMLERRVSTLPCHLGPRMPILPLSCHSCTLFISHTQTGMPTVSIDKKGYVCSCHWGTCLTFDNSLCLPTICWLQTSRITFWGLSSESAPRFPISSVRDSSPAYFSLTCQWAVIKVVLGVQLQWTTTDGSIPCKYLQQCKLWYSA